MLRYRKNNFCFTEEKIFNLESYSEEFEAQLSDKFGAKAVTLPSVARPTYVEEDGEIYIRNAAVDKNIEETQHARQQSESQNTSKSRSTTHDKDGRESRSLLQSDVKYEDVILFCNFKYVEIVLLSCSVW